MKLDFSDRTTAWTVGSGVVAALLVLPNLGKGWEALKYLADSPPAAYAAKAMSEAVRSDFDRYIEAQTQALQQEQLRLELQQEYNQKLMEMQQQQRAPTQPMVPGIPANPTPPGIPEVWIEPALVDGRLVCADGEGRWWWRTGAWDWGDGRGCAE